MAYIHPPLETDASDLQQEAQDWIRSRWPAWDGSEGNLEVWLIAAISQMVAESRDVASDVPQSIFRWYGRSVLGVLPVEPTYAQVDTTWTFSDALAHTIPAGTGVYIDGPDGDPIVFETITDVVRPAGAAPLTGVTVRAGVEGSEASGLGGVGLVVDADPFEWVTSVSLEGITSGGNDGESDEAYQDRLSNRLTLLTPRPILPRDYELLAIDIAAQNGVKARALALDGYNPANGSTNNERMVAVAMIDDETGTDLPLPIRTTVQTQLDAAREVNFVVNVINPNRTTVDVTFTVKTLPGYLAAAVEAAAEAATASYLNPANWGQPYQMEERVWIQTDKVRYLELATVLNNVEGVDYVSALTVGINGGAQGGADITLPGAVPVAQPGVINGTAN